MSSHPNRSKTNRSIAGNPTPTEIRRLRDSAGLTAEQFASLLHTTRNAVKKWETYQASPEHRRMHPALWELAFLKVSYILAARKGTSATHREAARCVLEATLYVPPHLLVEPGAQASGEASE